MRTTLNIEDELLRRAKHEAVDRGESLSEFVSRALREALRAAEVAGRDTAKPFRVPVHGPAEPRVHHEPADFHDALASEDDDALRG